MQKENTLIDIKFRLKLPSLIPTLMHRVSQRASFTGYNNHPNGVDSLQWIKQISDTTFKSKNLRLKPKIFQKQPLWRKVHWREWSGQLGRNWMCGNSVIKATIANQRAALEWCRSTVIKQQIWWGCEVFFFLNVVIRHVVYEPTNLLLLLLLFETSTPTQKLG